MTGLLESGQSLATRLVPTPRRVCELNGHFVLTSATVIVAGEGVVSEARDLATRLARSTGFGLEVRSEAPQNRPAIQLRRDSSRNQTTERETDAYFLRVEPGTVLLEASGRNGFLNGFSTLLQLFPPAIFDNRIRGGIEWSAPAVLIEDHPAFVWRGVMLDTARHFFPVDFILRWIELLALHKFNRFHWHLTDDQGWRLEVPGYPRLTEIGAIRSETVRGHPLETPGAPMDGETHGGTYSASDVLRVIDHAHRHGIVVVPEIEMPGHAQAAIAAYPELGPGGTKPAVSGTWGIHDQTFRFTPTTVGFLEDVLGEVLRLFPGRYVHIGGDEVPCVYGGQGRTRPVNGSPPILDRFMNHFSRFLLGRGRVPLGWDEILDVEGLPGGAVPVCWRGDASVRRGLLQGRDVILAPGSHAYFDHYQSADRAGEPLAIGGCTTLEKAHGFRIPDGDDLPGDKGRILGAQAQIWTEYMATPSAVEYMALPRLCAFADACWDGDRRDFRSFQEGLRVHLRRLDCMGYRYRALDEPNSFD